MITQLNTYINSYNKVIFFLSVCLFVLIKVPETLFSFPPPIKIGMCCVKINNFSFIFESRMESVVIDL